MAGLMRALQGIFAGFGLSGLLLDLSVGSVMALAVMCAVPAVGKLAGYVRGVIHRGLRQAVGPDWAFAVMNWLTFPGVMAHELAHALIAKLCGARIDEVKLFRPAGDSLGYVRFTCRGNGRKMAFQAAASSCAPVFMGFVTIRLLASLAASLPGYWQVQVLAYHAAFSTACHMTMSAQDMKNYKKGCVRLFACLVLAGFVISYIIGRGPA